MFRRRYGPHAKDALASFDMALRLRPKYAEAYNNRGSVLATLQRADEALDSYGRAVALTSSTYGSPPSIARTGRL